MRNKLRKPTSNNLLPLFLILAGVVLGLAVLIVYLIGIPGSQENNNPSTGQERVSLANAKQAYDQGRAVFLDVRPADSFRAGHIPGSVNIPLEELEIRANELDPNDWIIPYCT